MLEQRRGNGGFNKFSLRGSRSLQDSGYETRPVKRLFSFWKERPHALVVGGGDLLRTDWMRVASHYLVPISLEEQEDFRSGKVEKIGFEAGEKAR